MDAADAVLYRVCSVEKSSGTTCNVLRVNWRENGNGKTIREIRISLFCFKVFTISFGCSHMPIL